MGAILNTDRIFILRISSNTEFSINYLINYSPSSEVVSYIFIHITKPYDYILIWY